MPLILYRADGGPTVGTGHILRALRLAKCWSEVAPDARVLLVTHEAESVRQLVDSAALANLEPSWLPPGDLGSVPVLVASDLAEAASRAKPDAIVIDMLDTDATEMMALRELAPTLVSLDDRGDGRVCSDLIINFLVRDPDPSQLDCRGDRIWGHDSADDNNVSSPKSFARPHSISLHEGPEYATLANEFQNVPPRKPEPPIARRILVSLGGADPGGLAVKVAEALVSVIDLERVDFAIGVAFQQMEALENAVVSAPWKAYIHKSMPSLLPLYQTADLAIVAGGITMHEAACCGVPSVAVCQSIDHQLLVAGWLQEAGCMVNLGYGEHLSPLRIADAVSALVVDQPRREAMSDAGPRVCDGRGTVRVAKLILERIAK